MLGLGEVEPPWARAAEDGVEQRALDRRDEDERLDRGELERGVVRAQRRLGEAVRHEPDP